MRFPESLASGGMLRFIGASAALVAYWAVSEWVRRTSLPDFRLATTPGAAIGILIGALGIGNHFVEVFSGLRAPVPAVLGVGMFGLMFLGFGSASSTAHSRTHAVGPSIFASVWSALVSSATIVFFALTIGLLFTTRMQIILASEIAASGVGDPRAFVVRNLFDGAFTHLVVAPLVSAIVGAVSFLVLLFVRRAHGRALLVLSTVDLLVLGASIFAIYHASSLPRSARPPFITSGLIGLCLALASASPLAIAIRSLDRRLSSPSGS